MPHVPRLLVDLAMVLGVGAVTSVVFRWLRWPVVLGYVLAGLIVGPHVPVPLVADEGNVRTLGDLGVTLLMFSIGLEFNLGRLRRAGPGALLMTAIQMGMAAWLGFLVALAFGWTRMEAVFAGVALAIGSTMLLAKLFDEQEPPRALREVVFSMLVMQDLFAIILLTTLTATAHAGSMEAGPVGHTLLRLGLFLAVVLPVGIATVPRVIRWVADRASAETLLVVCCGLCFALAVTAAVLGLSLALGAFLAGMLASESGRSRVVEHLVAPLKNLFTTIFFVAVGMLIEPRALLPMAPAILCFSGLVIVANSFSTTVGGIFAGHGFNLGLRGGMALSQIGEFSYILLGTGVAAGVVRSEIYSAGVAIGVVTAALTPLLLGSSEAVAVRAEAGLPASWRLRMGQYQAWAEGLRRKRFRRESGPGRRFLFLLGDAALLVGFTLASHALQAWMRHWLEGLLPQGRWWAHAIVSAMLGGIWAILVYGLVSLGRQAARELAHLAPVPPMEASVRKGRHILAGGLRIAILLMIALPLLAILQPFVPRGSLFLVALSVFVAVLLLQLRASLRPTRSLTERLFSRFRSPE